MESVTNAAGNAAKTVSDTVQGTTAQGSKEVNKNVAKDSDAGIGTRAGAAKDAVSDKTQEVKHKS